MPTRRPSRRLLDEGIAKALEKLSPANLKEKGIDAVIFANTTGMLPLPDRDGFIKWIEEGHGFIAMHSGSDTFHQFPGYIGMLGGEFETHKAQVPAELVAGDTDHPANAGIGPSWNLVQEEMYHIKSQDPAKVRALWFMRHDPNAPESKVFFPVSWCKMAGKGRVFYTSLGHREDLWSDSPEIKDRKNSVGAEQAIPGPRPRRHHLGARPQGRQRHPESGIAGRPSSAQSRAGTGQVTAGRTVRPTGLPLLEGQVLAQLA